VGVAEDGGDGRVSGERRKIRGGGVWGEGVSGCVDVEE